MEQKERRQQTRRWLRRWGDCTRYCISRQQEARELQASIDSCADIRSPSMDGMPHGSVTSDPTARAAEVRAKMVALYQARIDEILEDVEEEMRFSNQIDYAVSTLEPRQRKVIELMYKRKRGIGYICRVMNYSKASVWRTENEACDILSGIL